MSLREKTFSGIFWTLSEKLGLAFIQFLVLLVLARLLEPKDFGIVASLSIFMSLSRVIITSGFGQALIRDQEVDDQDYSSVFWINVLLGIVLYSLLFFCAPLIAAFYESPAIEEVVRALSVILVLSSFSVVHNTILVKQLSFKLILIIRLPSLVIGGAVGIIMAYKGYGVWSLVYQQIVTQTINTIQLFFRIKWRPSLSFNFKKLKSLFAFGSKIMVSGIIDVLYNNFDALLIAKTLSVADLGYYQRAKSTRQLPIDSLSSSFSTVTFPVLASIGNDDLRLRNAYSRIICQAFFLMTPLLIFLAVLGEPLFVLLFTQRWLPSVPYFQWLCVSGIFQVINSYNLNILKVKGMAASFLKVNLIKKMLQIGVTIVAIDRGILFLVSVLTIFEFFSYLYYSHFCGKVIGFGLLRQLSELAPIALLNLLLAAFLFFGNNFLQTPDLLTLAILSFGGLSLYLGLAYSFKFRELAEVLDLIEVRIKGKTL